MFIIPFRQIAIMSLETVTPVSNSNNCISYCDLYLLTTTITLISAVGHGPRLPDLAIQPTDISFLLINCFFIVIKVEQGAVDTKATELNVTCRAGKNVKLTYINILLQHR